MTVIIDGARVTQILQNVLLKALQATAHGKVITIEASVSSDPANNEERRLNLAVSIVGEVFSETERLRLFDVTNEETIGFHVAQRLCVKLGGKLEVTCADGMTKFIFYVTI